jgi:hypothetical protein
MLRIFFLVLIMTGVNLNSFGQVGSYAVITAHAKNQDAYIQYLKDDIAGYSESGTNPVATLGGQGVFICKIITGNVNEKNMHVAFSFPEVSSSMEMLEGIASTPDEYNQDSYNQLRTIQKLEVGVSYKEPALESYPSNMAMRMVSVQPTNLDEYIDAITNLETQLRKDSPEIGIGVGSIAYSGQENFVRVWTLTPTLSDFWELQKDLATKDELIKVYDAVKKLRPSIIEDLLYSCEVVPIQ